MKRVLITGGAGFIGHHVIEHILNETDWEIISLDRLDISGNLNRLSDMLENLDITKKKKTKNFIS
jgi:dTDP-glucose 4,6-dehydratase